MISEDFKEKLKKATDIRELVSEYTDLENAGRGIWHGICPHPDHKDDNPSLVVWEESQSWACMGCHCGKKNAKYKNYGSDCIAFVQFVENIGFKQAIDSLAKRAGIEPEKDKHHEEYEKRMRLAKTCFKKLTDSQKRYLFERGLNHKDLLSFLIGCYKENGAQWITFPLFDRYKRVLGFSRRFFTGKGNEPKYKNSPNSEIFSKGHYLYGMHLYDKDFDEIRIVEGCMDAIVPYKYGVKNLLATIGTSFTEHHIDIIKNLGRTPVLCMDSDEAGRTGALKAADMLSQAGVSSKIFNLPENIDMDELALELKEDTEQYILDNSTPYGQLVVQEIVNKYDARVNEARLKLYPEVKELIGRIQNPDECLIIKNYIREKTGIEL